MKKYFILLGIIEAFIALGAIPAGYGFLSDTTGITMGNSVAMLEKSPLKSFLVPGLFLVIVHGFGNIFGAILAFRKKHSAGITGAVLGIILIFWILIQVYWIGLSSFMQPLFLGIGIAEAALGWFVHKRT
jgi:hypothetical protein